MCGRFEWVLFINDLFQGGCCNSFNLQWRLSCAATLSYSLITFFFRAAVATDSFYNGGFMCGRLVSALIAGFVRPRKGKEIYLNLSIYLSIYPCEPSCLSVWLVCRSDMISQRSGSYTSMLRSTWYPLPGAVAQEHDPGVPGGLCGGLPPPLRPRRVQPLRPLRRNCDSR